MPSPSDHAERPEPPPGVTARDQTLRDVLAAATDPVTTVDRGGTLLYANPAAIAFFGIGDPVARARWGTPPDWAVDRYRQEVRRALRTTGRWSGELAFRRDDVEVAVDITFVAHRDEAGRIGRVSAITRPRAAAAAHAPVPATPVTDGDHDELTGLPSLDLVLRRLGEALDRSAEDNSGVAVLCCDLDRFRVVNEGLGAAVGDEVLRRVGGRLARCVRPGDTVARSGADEFVILAPGLGTPREAVLLSERVQTAVRRPLVLEGSELVPTLSIGIAYDDRGASRPEALVRDADAALHRARAGGRDRAEVFDDGLRRRALARLDTEAGLRRALDDERLVVHYQPVIDLRDDRVTGFEALMRWDHPERGLLAPGEFMAVAEETGLIVDLGRRVFADACRQTVAWQATHDARLGVFVNFSASQLRHPDVIEDVTIVLGETGIDPACVQIEVTEHALLDETDVAIGHLSALKGLGVKIVIDDFGTGYSSLSYLQRFPVDLLKVDRSFVAGVARDEGDAAIVRGVIDLAHRLGLTAVAEGVEDTEQMAVLRELGCERAQGYLLGRPAGADAQGELLATRRPAGSHLRAVTDAGDGADTGAA